MQNLIKDYITLILSVVAILISYLNRRNDKFEKYLETDNYRHEGHTNSFNTLNTAIKVLQVQHEDAVRRIENVERKQNNKVT